jgi:hypothetical protein
MPKKEMPPAPAKGKQDEPRTSGKLRAERYGTWEELHAAVLGQCRAELASLNPILDIADFERQAAQWRRPDERPLRAWRAVRDAYLEASALLEEQPAPYANIYTAQLEGYLSALCQGAMGDFSLSIGERLSTWVWPPIGASSRPPSFRTCLVSMLVRARSVFLSSAAALELQERSERVVRRLALPKRSERLVRELALLTLLADCASGSARSRQSRPDDADRPTVSDVVRAEANAVRLILNALEEPASERGAATPELRLDPPRQGGQEV